MNISMAEPTDTEIREILRDAKVIAVVGLSPNPARPSHQVAAFLQSRGYRVLPVNPGHAGTVILGETVHARLADLPADAAVDMVDVFRRSDAVAGIVDAVIAHLPGVRTIWTQLGVRDDAAAARARGQGIAVVQDRCPAIEYPRLMHG